MIDLESLIGGRPRPGRPGSTPGGCAKLKRVEGFGPNPGALTMWSYVPSDLPRGAPLVVVIHGCGQTAQGYAEGAGWLTLADRFGFAVVCPEQTAANNPNRCFNWFEPGDTRRDAGEAASIRQMVASAIADNGLDPRRVFVTGLSAGGGMTAVMLATYPEVFAAGAIVAGLPYGAANGMGEAFGAMMQGKKLSPRAWGDKVRGASAHTGPWPRLSVWHGDADTTVRPGAADDTTSQWLDVHGLPDDPAQARSAKGRPYLVWRSQSGETLVEQHRLVGMGHGTPLATGGEDGCGTAGPFLLEVGVSSSLEIAAFWGIATVQSERATAKDRIEPGRPANDIRGPATPHQPRGPLPVDVGDVISKALRAAGLMK